MIQKVNPARNNGSRSGHTYAHVVKDSEGWADAKLWLPADYDLCWVQTDKGKKCIAWLSGNFWEGLKLGDKDKIVCWKRKNDD